MALISRRFADNERLQIAAENSPPLKKGATGKAVEILQRTLIDLGFAMPNSTAQGKKLADGIYGDETARTVLAFQAQQGLQQDGVAGRDTLNRLDQLLAAAEAMKSAMRPIEAQRYVWT